METSADPSIGRIVRAFTAARVRFDEATNFEDQEDETSNMLHHLYRLVERRGGVRSLGAPEETHHAAALVLFRNKDTHSTTVTKEGDVFGATFGAFFGTLLWDMTPEITGDSRFVEYDAGWLKGRSTRDTLVAAFDELA